jgi:hypothetical protein
LSEFREILLSQREIKQGEKDTTELLPFTIILTLRESLPLVGRCNTDKIVSDKLPQPYIMFSQHDFYNIFPINIYLSFFFLSFFFAISMIECKID